MNPRDRLIAVLEKREPDHIPIVFQSIPSSKVSGELMKASGLTAKGGPTYLAAGITYQMYKDFLNKMIERNPSNWKNEFNKIANMVASAPIDVSLFTKLGIDAFFYSPQPGKVMVLDENRVVNEFGSIYTLGQANGELHQWYSGGYLKTPEQRDEWALSMPVSDRFDSYRAALKTCGDKVYPIGFLGGIFEHTWQSMGFTEFSINLWMNPSFLKKVYGEYARFVEEGAKLFIDAGAEVLGIGDDVAYKNNLIVSPKMWAEFVKPKAENIVNSIHKRGALVFMHSDGYITPLIDQIIEAGYDGIQSLEPLAGVNLAEVKEKYGGKIALIGGIDTSQLLPYGTEKDVQKAVKEAVKVAGKGGGYAIGPCTDIHWKCRPENVLALIKYVRKYGQYPLRI